MAFVQNSKIVVRLVQPLVNLGYTLWMDNYHNSSSPCRLLRDNGNNIADTLHLNRKHVPQLVKSKTLAKGESVTAKHSGIMGMKWSDKRQMSFISTFHDNTMQAQTVRGT
jgi:hypothetical protein